MGQFLNDFAPLITMMGFNLFMVSVIRFVKVCGLSKTVIQLDIKLAVCYELWI
jgi:hypothetical protein